MNSIRTTGIQSALRALAACVALGMGGAFAAESPPPRIDPETHRPVAEEPAARASARARLLSASCAACHGTEGRSAGITPVLAGLGEEYFTRQMQDFQSGARPGTVMNTHAAAFGAEEITLMAKFFASVPRPDCDTRDGRGTR